MADLGPTSRDWNKRNSQAFRGGLCYCISLLREGEEVKGIREIRPQLASKESVALRRLILKIRSDRPRRWVRKRVAVWLVVELDLMEKVFNIDVICSLHVRVAGRRFRKLKVGWNGGRERFG
jgi:hypothetical protein